MTGASGGGYNTWITAGEEEFRAAAALASQGKTAEAIAAFTRLRREYRDSWIDRVAAERLAKLQPAPQFDGRTQECPHRSERR